MKILLVNPWEGELFPPPSIGYLQAAAKTVEGVEVTALDWSEALKNGFNGFDIVAASFHSFSVVLARELRQSVSGKLICGGHHPSALPQQMIDLGYDQVIIGEGEKAIIQVINGDTNQIINGEPCNLDEIPFPDYTGLKHSGALGLPVISSRGCPYDCVFCASAKFWGRRYRMRSVDNVLAEIKALPTNQFMFEDDNFTLNRQRVLDICEGIKELGGYRWQCASRAETLVDEELCRALRLAGCHTVWLGVESLSQDTLDRCSKNTTVGKMMLGIANAEKAGLTTMSQFIVGLPDDTLDNIEETVRNIRRSAITRKGTNTLWVLPNTEVHRLAKMKGFDDAVYLDSGAPFYYYERSPNTLEYWSHLINTAK